LVVTQEIAYEDWGILRLKNPYFDWAEKKQSHFI
jgi:hypothetical protein